MHTVFVAALKAPTLQHLLFELDNSSKLAPISFADDTLICMQLNDEKDVVKSKTDFLGSTSPIFLMVCRLIEIMIEKTIYSRK